jgi:uncharacterized repeat protein (TIGR01451 family)
MIAFLLNALPAFAQTNIEFGTNDFQVSDIGTPGDANFDANNSAVAFNSDENEYFVVWQADDDTGSLVDGEFEIYGQRVNTLSGALEGSQVRLTETDVDGDADFDALEPAIAYNSATNQFLLVFVANDPSDTDDFDVYGLLVNANGTLVDEDPFKISDMDNEDSTTRGAAKPAVIYNANEGEFFVVWSGAKNTEDEFEIWGRRIGSDGTVIDADDIQISDMGPDTDDAYGAFRPAVGLSPESNYYLVAWVGDNNADFQIDDEFEIFVQQIDASDGSEIGDNDVRISDMGDLGNTTYTANNPAIAYDSGAGQFLVVWDGSDDENSDTSQEIYGQFLLESDLTEVGSNDFQISDLGPANSATYKAADPAIQYNDVDDEFLVVFGGDDDASGDDEYEVFGQRIAAGTSRAETGNNDFSLSDVDSSSDTTPALAFDDSLGVYGIFWEADDNGAGLAAGEFEIFGQFMALRASDLEITGSVSPDPVTARDALTYSLMVTNNGGDDSGEATLSAPLPSGLALASYSGTGWTCGILSGSLECEIDDITNGDTSSLTVVFATGEVTASPIDVTFTVALTEGFDPTEANDSVSLTTGIEVNCTMKKPKVKKNGSNARLTIPKALLSGLVEKIKYVAVRKRPSKIVKRKTKTPRRRVKFKNLTSGTWKFRYIATLRDSSICKSKVRKVTF